MSKYLKYLFLFIFSFFAMSFFLTYFDGDVLWNYGFSYALSNQEIPYRDFNMIITPLYPFIMSFLLKINTNIIFFYLENALLITILFVFLFKLFDYKAWLFLILLFFPIPSLVFPSYNLFLIFLFIVIIYLEKKEANDYLIGFIIGLSFLTKQSVGLFLLLPSIFYYFKSFSKLLKRLLGFLFPLSLFFFYLLITKSLTAFLDLCLFGLFDFSSSNSSSFNIALIIGLTLIIISIILFLKHKNNINYFYVLCFASIMVPLFDYPHIEYFVFAFLILFVDKITIPKKNLLFNTLLFSIAFVLIFFFFTTFQGNIHYPNKFHNFNYRLLYDKNGEDYIRNKMIQYINTNKDKEIIILASDAYFYKITCDLKITSFDLLNKGNHGYHGTNKIKSKLASLKKGTIIIVDTNETYSSRSNNSIQFNRDIALYGIKLGQKITKIGGYTIYEKKD